ncbi:MAG: YicC family protein [Candidatus Omnitrophica bacterium]|nr:YicC family protein [Candidatus Omnitrophota bacterium]MDD5670983.1 YicC family protein [Candidatus Omnitrophota bacterium]
MIRSMTAFSKATGGRQGGGYWVVEIRSLNHRFFECFLKLPQEFSLFESDVRELVRSRISRGKINLTVIQSLAAPAEESLMLNEEMVKHYLAAIRKLKRRFGLQGEVSVKDLLGLPELFTVNKSQESQAEKWRSLQSAIKKSLGKAVMAKEVEGRKIGRDMMIRLKHISRAVDRVEKNAASRGQYYFGKVKKKVEELLGAAEKDDERIWREVAFLAEKSDLTEEIVRMKAHLELFAKRMNQEAEVGRELDFLCQEMHREINTMGSKAQLFEISRDVVYIKGELEKIREQVQNVE